MSRNIEFWRLTDVLEDIIDNRGKSVPTVESGFPLIATNCIKHSSLYPTFENIRFVSNETLKNWFRAHLKPNDILFVNKGTPGRVCLVPNPVNFCAAQDMIGFRCKKEIIDYKYLFAVLRSSFVQTKIKNYHVGLVIPHFKKHDLDSILIPKKKKNEQRKIGEIYVGISEKIELNNKINRELEAMAKTLYDYWFVQFDFPCLPSDYRPSGQVNPNSELTRKIKAVCTYTQTGGLPLPDGKKWFLYVLLCNDDSFYIGITNDIYRRYYEHKTGQGAKWTKAHKPIKVIHFEEFDTQQEAAKREKELKTGYGRTWLKREYDKFIKYGYPNEGGLPAPKEGIGSPAHQTRLMMAGKMVYNKELKREIPEGWEVVKLGDYAEITKGDLITEKEAQEGYVKVVAAGLKFSYYHNKHNRDENTITISASGANAGYVNFWREPIFASDCTTVRGGNDIETIMLLHYLKLLQTHISSQAKGSAQPHVYPDDIRNLYFSVPPKNLIEQYGKIILPANKQIANNIKENQQLSALRDWLLPMLMNGQVTVKEAEEKLSMAAEPQAEYKKG